MGGEPTWTDKNASKQVEVDSDPLGPEEWLFEAEIAKLEGRFWDALINLESVLRAEPEVAEAYIEKGLILTLLGRGMASLVALERALEIHPDDFYAYSLMGDALLGIGRCEDASVSYGRSNELNPNYVDSNIGRGMALAGINSTASEHDYDVALKELDRRIANDNEDAKAYGLRGTVWLLRGDFDRAKKDMDRSIEIQVFQGIEYEVYLWRGLARLASADHEGALRDYHVQMDLYPECPEPYLQVGVALTALGRVDEAKAALSQAIQMGSRNSQAYWSRGLLLQGEGSVELALSDFEEAISIDPGEAISHYGRGANLLELERLEEGLTSLSQAISLDGTDIDYFVARSNGYGALGRIEDAIGDLGAALELDESRVDLYICRAMYHRQLGDDSEAVDDLIKATELDPTCDTASFELGKIVMGHSTGDPEDHAIALGFFDDAIEANPNAEEYHEKRAEVLVLMGDNARAIESLGFALALAPTDALYFSRAKAWFALGDSEAALRDLTNACTIQPQKEYLSWRGALSGMVGRYGEAMEFLDAAIELGGDTMDYFNRAWAKAEFEQFPAAIQDLHVALQMDPHNEGARDKLAEVMQHIAK